MEGDESSVLTLATGFVHWCTITRAKGAIRFCVLLLFAGCTRRRHAVSIYAASCLAFAVAN